MTSASQSAAGQGLHSYFSLAQARVDRWRSVHRAARALAAGSAQSDALRAQAAEDLKALAPLEELCAYPGPRLMAVVHERLQTRDFAAFARLAQRISMSLLSNSYRDDAEAWRVARMHRAVGHILYEKRLARGRAESRDAFPYFRALPHLDSRQQPARSGQIARVRFGCLEHQRTALSLHVVANH
jgi:hypothetical protein